MGIEGQLKIALRIRDGRVGAVDIGSSRPVHASRVLQGRLVGEALGMLPMLFTICSTAQSCAGVRACEQALGRRPGARLEGLRDALVRLETVREHLWRILLDWPGFLDEPPQPNGMSEMLVLHKALRQALTRGDDPFRIAAAAGAQVAPVPAPLLERLQLTLARAVFGMAPADWLDIEHPSTLSKWAAEGVTVAARLIDRVEGRGWSDLGRCRVAALPPLEHTPLDSLRWSDAFVERPSWFDDSCETSCLTRVGSPLLGRLDERHGNGLLVRLVARLTELARLAGGLCPGGGTVVHGDGHNPGIGHSIAARGQLLHRVKLNGERVAAYQILAPTEWHFHPRGVVARSLAGVAGTREQMEQQARLLINAIDPCVSYELSID
ncbi:MAG: hypothetical protein AB2813_13820 [Candidatus Sedimenticola endophacoides]